MCRARVYGLSWQPYQIIQGCLHILLYVSPGQRVVTLLWQNSTFSSLIIPQLSLIWCIVDHTNTIGFLLLLFFLILSYISFFFFPRINMWTMGWNSFREGWIWKFRLGTTYMRTALRLMVFVFKLWKHYVTFMVSATLTLDHYLPKNDVLIINFVICDVELTIRKNLSNITLGF